MSAFLVTVALYEAIYGIFEMVLCGRTASFPPFLPRGFIELGGIAIDKMRLASFVIALVVFAGVWAFLQYSKVGLAMRATAEDHRLAQSGGIHVKQIFSHVWVISGIVCLVAGILLGSIMDIHYSLAAVAIIALAVAMVGGLDSIPGALVGGLLVGVLQNLGGGYVDPIVGGGFADLTAYIVLLIILLVKPYGLFGEVRIERI
jgi:branched-chain amino acid transport system permease protein